MNISDELLARYFKGKCTAEESLSIANYLKEIDDLPAHLLSKDDWDDADDALISKDESDEMFAEIKKETISKELKLRKLRILSAAAVILMMLTIGFLMINKPEPFALGLAKNKIDKKEKGAQIIWKSFVNYTSNNQLLELPDGSSVKVYPDGEIRYAIPFIKNNREVYLKGKGFFQVAKDKAHPFIVYSKGISTTALGTSFTITADDKSSFIKVKLHTGKVWIKSVSDSTNILSFSKILMPGNELVYNSLKHQVKVTDKTKLAKETVRRNDFTFTQASLKDVFEKLKDNYKVKIFYNEADLSEISFTGTIDLNQKPEKILKEITELNKLNLTKTTESYIISK